MKQRSTTPVSKGLVTKSVIVAAAVVMAISGPLAMMPQAKADKYDNQIRAIQRQIDEYQAQAGKLRNQADTLQKKLDGINNEKAQLQARINLNEAKYNKLVNQIEQTKKDIQNNRDALGEIIADLSVDESISPLEMLASSKNIGDYLDKQAYQSSVRDQLTGTIKTINDLKAKLEKQKKDVTEVLNNQKRARQALTEKQQEQQQLISETRGKESAYQKLSAQSEQQKLEVMQAQAAAIAAASAGNGGVRFVGGGSGGYPWTSSNCYVDGNAMSHGGANGNGGDGWGYGCRQCASYAAWKIGQRTGIIPTDLGNANQFPYAYPASRRGTVAHKNSVGVISAGQYGHVVWVESEPDSQGFITVSQYNANYTGDPGNWGNFSRVRVHQSTYDTFIYF